MAWADGVFTLHAGKKRLFRPVAPPVFEGKAHGNRLGRRWKAKCRRERKDFFDTLKQLSQTGTARSAAAAFFWRGGMGDFTKKKRLFAGLCKISSEVQKSSCIVHRCTVYNLIAKKERRNGMLAGAAPVTFRVEKRTFRADGPARRGKYATLSVEN